jgi:hypothetical protein
MKAGLFLATTLAIQAQARDHVSFELSVLTYQTFFNQKVETATTTLSGMRTPHVHHHHSAQTSYSFNFADNEYPTFSTVVGPLATDAPAPGLPNATVLALEGAALIEKFKVSSLANCQLCQNIMAGVAARMKVQQETLSDIALPFCTVLQVAITLPVCIGLLKVCLFLNYFPLSECLTCCGALKLPNRSILTPRSSR